MIITIFGATGMVGSRLVKLGLAQGFVVRAFGRNIEGMIDSDIWEDKFEAIKGYVLDEQDVHNAIKGSHAVLSALGGAMDGVDKTRSLGMKNIVKQMHKLDVSRIIAIGGLGVLDASEGKLRLDMPDYPAEYKPVGREHLEAYQHLRNSQLRWTFVCPPNILNKDHDGRYVTSANYPPAYNRNHITAGNLAHFMLTEVQNNQYVQQKVGISDAS